jgi:hypothetical protein
MDEATASAGSAAPAKANPHFSNPNKDRWGFSQLSQTVIV